MTSRVRLVGATVHTGAAVIPDAVVTVADGRIVDVTDASRAAAPPTALGVAEVDLRGRLLAPGFVDLMVNGGGGVTFNEDPERLPEIVAAHRALGTTSFLPNLITDTVPRMRAARRVVDEFAGNAVLGIHFEGPVLSHERRGMHAARHLSRDFPFELARPRPGTVTLVTVAPDVAGPAFVSRLRECGALVALGHTEATCEQIVGAIDAGASLVTHLFNGMPPLTGRSPGLVGAALADHRLCASIINDGVHVDFTSVRVAWLAKPAGTLFFVTDAMAPVGGDLDEFTHAGVRVRRCEGRLVTDDGRLGGSLLTLHQAVRNAVEHVGIPVDEALRMASVYPARYLGVDDRIGVIKPGAVANVVVLDEALRLSGVMFEGQWVA